MKKEIASAVKYQNENEDGILDGASRYIGLSYFQQESVKAGLLNKLESVRNDLVYYGFGDAARNIQITIEEII